MSYYVYILFSDSINKYYVGYSHDPWLRLTYHNSNEKDKYTGKGKPWNLCAVLLAENKTAAISCERFIKKQKSKVLIEKLCNPEFISGGKF
jgi:putative endonuclease